MKSALIATKEIAASNTIEECLKSLFQCEVEVVSSDRALYSLRDKNSYELVFIDITYLIGSSKGGKGRYVESIMRFKGYYQYAEIVVLSVLEKLREAVMLVKAGAVNYLTYPVDRAEVELIVETMKETQLMQTEIEYLREKAVQEELAEFGDADSHVMSEVIRKIKSVAPTKTSVLLTGETGTGKGLAAKYIHFSSNRRDRQFISLHCGAVPDTLLESELFGHERGAFTGATKKRLGKFELASGGTIFLDEIGTITPSMQIKLLQVLQDRTLQRIGSEKTIEVDVRVIAASNENLEEKVSHGGFRKDLYYRLNVFPVEIPPLRERKEDIQNITDKILKKLNRYYVKNIGGIDSRIVRAFKNYQWPGNIRELENLIERAYILENSPVLTPENFPEEIFSSIESRGKVSIDTSRNLSSIRRQALNSIEREYLTDILTRHRGSVKHSAEAAGITVRQLHKLMKKYDLKKEEYKALDAGTLKSD